VIGCFELNNPKRIRSLRKKEKKDHHPYEYVTCTVEWYPQKDYCGSKAIEVKDSIITYEEVRKKAPQLLCDYFERHMTFE
jgi:hypothetical protein